MYPTIHTYDAGSSINPLHAPYPTPGASSNTAGPSTARPPAQPPRAANGPQPPSPQPAFPTLQVAIDPKFQVAPPVQAPSQPPGEGGPAAGAAARPPPPGQPAPGSQEPLDLGLEKKLLQDLGASGSGRSSDGGSRGLQASQREDPYDVLLARYTVMGYSRAEVAMGLTVVGPDSSDDADTIVDAVRKFRSLRSMGFSEEQVVGALLLHKGNETQAIETCLAAGAAP